MTMKRPPLRYTNQNAGDNIPRIKLELGKIAPAIERILALEETNANSVISYNAREITVNTTFPDNRNGLSVGPVTIGATVSVIVPTGASWVIL